MHDDIETAQRCRRILHKPREPHRVGEPHAFNGRMQFIERELAAGGLVERTADDIGAEAMGRGQRADHLEKQELALPARKRGDETDSRQPGRRRCEPGERVEIELGDLRG